HVDLDGLGTEIAQQRGLGVAARDAPHVVPVLHHSGDGRTAQLARCSDHEDVHHGLPSQRLTASVTQAMPFCRPAAGAFSATIATRSAIDVRASSSRHAASARSITWWIEHGNRYARAPTAAG